MTRYYIRDIQKEDYVDVMGIYNSNPHFLRTHLDMESVDATFISNEVSTMEALGFCSCVIIDNESQTIQGVLDYKAGEEVYLSLLMLVAELQGQGAGREIYAIFEGKMIQNGSTSIRIDVVNDYQGNVVPFWIKVGFSVMEETSLTWGNKVSRAAVMRKRVQ